MQNAWWTYWGFVSWHIKTYSLTSLSWNIVFLILHIITNSFLCEKVCNVLQSLFRLQFMLSNWNLKDIRRNKCNILFSFTDIYKQISELKVLCLSFSHTLRVWNCIFPITRGKDHRERCFYTLLLFLPYVFHLSIFLLSLSLSLPLSLSLSFFSSHTLRRSEDSSSILSSVNSLISRRSEEKKSELQFSKSFRF